MKFFHTLRQDLNKTIINLGFAGAALMTCILCFTASAYRDNSNDSRRVGVIKRSMFVGIVSRPRNRSVVCKNAVRHRAMTCLHQPVKPSMYPLGTENIYSEPTAIWHKRIPPRLIFANTIFIIL